MTVVIHKIREHGRLVVEHRFYGRDFQEAMRIYNAHRVTDEFLRMCDDCSMYKDIPCTVEVTVEE